MSKDSVVKGPKKNDKGARQNGMPPEVKLHHKNQVEEVTDQKMNCFLDEMRQQFLQT